MLLALAVCLHLSTLPDSPPPYPYEFRGAWVATVNNIDFPSRRGITEEEGRSEIKAIVAKAAELHLNALIFQVRPAADALYFSQTEPWSEFFTDQQGFPPDPVWDPLAVMIEEAHRAGIELHAWINPFRVRHFTEHGPPSALHLSLQHPDWVKKFGRYLWLDPGVPAARDHVIQVARDIVSRYDIDALHIDDYFYPAPETGASEFPDHDSYREYTLGGGHMSVEDWRRDNVNRVVSGLAKMVKEVKPYVKFGISPFGIARPGVPAGTQAGLDQYKTLYADPVMWLQEGWCDYLAPQLYWRIDRKPQAYAALLNYWIDQNKLKRHIWPGNFTSQLIESDWTADEIVRQIYLTEKTKGAGGNIQFSFKPLQENSRGITDALESGPYKGQTLVPPSPWLQVESPYAPSVEWRRSERTIRLAWNLDARSPRAQRWAVWIKYDSGWQFQVFGPQVQNMEIPLAGLQLVTVTAIGRNGLPGQYKSVAVNLKPGGPR
ncbi:MAG: family 10 glycosylhydrolase [Armatimonadetes bacterium]|nr:family 10 glycosylhydrolase [Armatimonadota bacterium]